MSCNHLNGPSRSDALALHKEIVSKILADMATLSSQCDRPGVGLACVGGMGCLAHEPSAESLSFDHGACGSCGG